MARHSPSVQERMPLDGGVHEQTLLSFCGHLVMTAPLPSLAQQAPVRIVGLVELSGRAPRRDKFRQRRQLAVKEINAGGGILGRKIEYTSSDTQVAPQTAKRWHKSGR